MTKDRKLLKVRNAIMPAINDYKETITKEKPYGCSEKLQKVVKIHDECQKGLGARMPSANKIGYGDIRDQMNNAMAHYGLRHSY